MTADYCSVFGLSAEPFSKEIDDADLWLPPSKQTLLDDLVDAVHARKSALLTGEPGAGKTCLLRALRHALSTENFRLTYCHNVTLGRRDFYRQLCIALGLPRSQTAGDIFFTINTHVEELAKERVFPVFLVDEAHLLHQDTLDHLHILLNYAWDSRALLSRNRTAADVARSASVPIDAGAPQCGGVRRQSDASVGRQRSGKSSSIAAFE